VNAHELFQAGRLKDAIAALVEDVRARPTDTGARLLLGELLCFSGDLERADNHLDAAGHADAQALPYVVGLRQLIRAEQARRDFFREGRLPQFLAPPEGAVRALLEASVRVRAGAEAEAMELLDQVEEQRPKVSGSCDGRPFQDLRDLDDLTSCVLEVLTSDGRYFWVPIADVVSLELRAPSTPRDLLWRNVILTVRGGPEGEVFLPVLYAGTEAEADDGLRLGRATEWKGGDGTPVRGVGQRTFLVGDDPATILEIGSLTLDQPGASA
jgi:type VI secretion system protein ImpE